MIDPFATEPEPVPDTTTTETKEKPVVVQGSEGKVVVTLKGGAGYDAPWIVIHASDVADANEQLNNAALKDLIEQTRKVGEFFSGAKAKAAQAASQPQQQVSRKPAGATQAPEGEQKFCAHGEMVYRSGISAKSGKPWKAFFCPQPKGSPDACDPQWAK